MPSGIYKRTKENTKNLGKAWKGKKHTEGSKIKISKSHTGLKHSAETKEKLRIGKLGALAPSWKGGVTYSKEYVNWQKNIRNRTLKRLRRESGLHTFGEWELLKQQYGYTCPCCQQTEPTIKLTIDHIVPLSKGGVDLIENIQPLCIKCNMKKHSKIIKYQNGRS